MSLQIGSGSPTTSRTTEQKRVEESPSKTSSMQEAKSSLAEHLGNKEQIGSMNPPEFENPRSIETTASFKEQSLVRSNDVSQVSGEASKQAVLSFVSDLLATNASSTPLDPTRMDGLLGDITKTTETLESELKASEQHLSTSDSLEKVDRIALLFEQLDDRLSSM